VGRARNLTEFEDAARRDTFLLRPASVGPKQSARPAQTPREPWFAQQEQDLPEGHHRTFSGDALESKGTPTPRPQRAPVEFAGAGGISGVGARHWGSAGESCVYWASGAPLASTTSGKIRPWRTDGLDEVPGR